MLIQFETGGRGKWTWDSYVRQSERLPAPRNCYQRFVGWRCEESRKINLDLWSQGSHLMTPWCEGCNRFSSKRGSNWVWQTMKPVIVERIFIFYTLCYVKFEYWFSYDRQSSDERYVFVCSKRASPLTRHNPKGQGDWCNHFFFSAFSIAKEGHNCSPTN